MPTSRAPTRPDLGPTPERRRRSSFQLAPAVAVDNQPARAGIRVYRAVTPLERLLRSNIIEPRQHLAGIRLRSDYEIGVIGVRQAAAGSSSSNGNHFSDVQLDAITRAKAAFSALGPTEPIVAAIAVLDFSITELARKIGGRRHEIAGILKLGLTALADHYQIDR